MNEKQGEKQLKIERDREKKEKKKEGRKKKENGRRKKRFFQFHFHNQIFYIIICSICLIGTMIQAPFAVGMALISLVASYVRSLQK